MRLLRVLGLLRLLLWLLASWSFLLLAGLCDVSGGAAAAVATMCPAVSRVFRGEDCLCPGGHVLHRLLGATVTVAAAARGRARGLRVVRCLVRSLRCLCLLWGRFT